MWRKRAVCAIETDFPKVKALIDQMMQNFLYVVNMSKDIYAKSVQEVGGIAQFAALYQQFEKEVYTRLSSKFGEGIANRAINR